MEEEVRSLDRTETGEVARELVTVAPELGRPPPAAPSPRAGACATFTGSGSSTFRARTPT